MLWSMFVFAPDGYSCGSNIIAFNDPNLPKSRDGMPPNVSSDGRKSGGKGGFVPSTQPVQDVNSVVVK